MSLHLPADLLDLVLSFHMPVCAEEFIGNPRYVLYWCYDISALKEVLGMTRDQFRIVQSNLGRFMRRVPRTTSWLSRLRGIRGYTAWAMNPSPLRTHPSPPGTGGAVARGRIAQKSYISLDGAEFQ